MSFEHLRSRNNTIRNLRHRSSDGKAPPRINLRLSLSGLEERAELDELGLQLLYQRRGNSECQEDREESRLHIDLRIFDVVECEAVEEAGKDVYYSKVSLS